MLLNGPYLTTRKIGAQANKAVIEIKRCKGLMEVRESKAGESAGWVAALSVHLDIDWHPPWCSLDPVWLIDPWVQLMHLMLAWHTVLNLARALYVWHPWFKVSVKDCNGGTIPVLRECTLTLRYKGKTIEQEFMVVHRGKQLVLCLYTCEIFGLIKRRGCMYTIERLKGATEPNFKALIASYDDVFTGNVCIPMTYKIW